MKLVRFFAIWFGACFGLAVAQVFGMPTWLTLSCMVVGGCMGDGLAVGLREGWHERVGHMLDQARLMRFLPRSRPDEIVFDSRGKQIRRKDLVVIRTTGEEAEITELSGGNVYMRLVDGSQRYSPTDREPERSGGFRRALDLEVQTVRP
jgi:hypothetical protein